LRPSESGPEELNDLPVVVVESSLMTEAVVVVRVEVVAQVVGEVVDTT